MVARASMSRVVMAVDPISTRSAMADRKASRRFRVIFVLVIFTACGLRLAACGSWLERLLNSIGPSESAAWRIRRGANVPRPFFGRETAVSQPAAGVHPCFGPEVPHNQRLATDRHERPPVRAECNRFDFAVSV